MILIDLVIDFEDKNFDYLSNYYIVDFDMDYLIDIEMDRNLNFVKICHFLVDKSYIEILY